MSVSLFNKFFIFINNQKLTHDFKISFLISKSKKAPPPRAITALVLFRTVSIVFFSIFLNEKFSDFSRIQENSGKNKEHFWKIRETSAVFSRIFLVISRFLGPPGTRPPRRRHMRFYHSSCVVRLDAMVSPGLSVLWCSCFLMVMSCLLLLSRFSSLLSRVS